MTQQAPADPDRNVVAGDGWYEQAGAAGTGALGLGMIALLSGCGVLVIAALGRIWPVFDVASHAGLHATGAVVGGVLALWLARSMRPVLALLSLPLVGGMTLAVPPLAASFATLDEAVISAPPARGALRIVVLNTWHSNQTPETMISFLERVRADIVVLSEFGPSKARWLKRLAKTYPHQAGCALNIYCAMQLISRHPIVAATATSRDRGPGPPRVVVRFGPELGGLTVIGVHMMRPIDSYLGNYREVRRVADMARNVAGGPVIVAGDFNLTGWSANWTTFRERSGLNHMGRFLPTWPAQPRGYPQLAIDHVFASPGVSFGQVGLGPAVGSDHRPLIVDVRLPAKSG